MDAWRWQDLLAPGISVGAPPDEFNHAGQDWGLPAFLPGRLAAAGYEPFVETIRSSLTRQGGLRIDHVMGLFRLWWIPDGAGPADGAYVRYPARDLLDIVALESVRHQAVVVGEDLGTVEPGVRDELAARDVLSYRLLWFEDDLPARWPSCAMAAVSTHDLPTVRGLWEGSDRETLRDLGVAANDDGIADVRRRLVAAADLDEDATADDAVVAAHRALGRAPARLVCATLDDLMVVAERPNIPGAPPEHPNWSLALPRPIEDLDGSAIVAAVSEELQRATASKPGAASGTPPTP
jgi:4-alpha-glucanotransferase